MFILKHPFPLSSSCPHQKCRCETRSPSPVSHTLVMFIAVELSGINSSLSFPVSINSPIVALVPAAFLKASKIFRGALGGMLGMEQSPL